MTVSINGRTYYRTPEACEIAGVSKSTFLRWIKEGVIEDVGHYDRRGWRLFTEEDVNRIRAEVNRIEANKTKEGR